MWNEISLIQDLSSGCIATKYICNYTCRNITTTSMSERRHFFRKIYLSLYSKRLCVRGELETEQRLQHIDPPAPPAIAVRLSRSPGLLNQGPGGPALCWELVPTARSGTLTSSSELQLPDFLSQPRLYHCSTPTQFKLSTAKATPWSLWPDAPVICTGAFLLTAWPGWRSICNTHVDDHDTIYIF